MNRALETLLKRIAMGRHYRTEVAQWKVVFPMNKFELHPDERKTLDILKATGPGRGPFIEDIARLVRLIARFMDHVITEESAEDTDG